VKYKKKSTVLSETGGKKPSGKYSEIVGRWGAVRDHPDPCEGGVLEEFDSLRTTKGGKNQRTKHGDA